MGGCSAALLFKQCRLDRRQCYKLSCRFQSPNNQMFHTWPVEADLKQCCLNRSHYYKHGYGMAIAYLSHLTTRSSTQGLQRQISFEEQRGRERITGLAESTSRSLSDQQRRLQEIAEQGMNRIQQTRDEGISKIASVQAAAVQVTACVPPL